jgi:outer membrane lipoprotein LolB
MTRILLVGLLALLTGCASVKQQFHQEDNNLYRPTPTTAEMLDTPFHASGRIAVQYDGKGQYGNFNWDHSAQHDELNLLSPLGNTVARLTRDDGGVTLQADGKVQQAADVETLTSQMLGWALPLDNLAWWIRGRSAPGQEIATSADGSLLQQGWQIHFQAGDQGGAVPKRVDLVRENLKIKLVTDQWQP